MTKKSIFYEKEFVDPFDGSDKNFLIKAEHYMRYQFARRYLESNKPNAKLIYDIACGNGYGSKILSDLPCKVFGFDKTQSLLKEANKKYNKPNLKYYQINLDLIPISNYILKKNIPSPDVIVCFETIEHLTSPDFFLNDLSLMLKSGDILICSIPNAKYEPTIDGKPQNIYHKHLFRKKEIVNLVEKNNFIIKQWYGQPLTNILINYFSWSSRVIDKYFMKSKNRFNLYAPFFASPIKYFNNLTYSFIIIAQRK